MSNTVSKDSWPMEAAGGWDVIFERVASGESQTDIAKGSRIAGFFSRVMGLEPERKAAFREAMRQRAVTYSDRALQIVDAVPPERDALAKAREQVGVLKWLAECGDREQFGPPSRPRSS